MVALKVPAEFTDFGITLEGESYIGKCNYIELPKFKKKTEEKRYAGSQVPAKKFRGYEAMETKISFPVFVKDAFKLFAIDGRVAQITARGAYKPEGGTAQSCVITIAGKFSEIDPGKWQSGEDNEFILTVDTRLLQIVYGGEQVINIDADNDIYTFGGVVDSNLDVKKAIGRI